jgi:murein DD-endopeptidase MepM/ murein hydrolase activator NlpD
MGRLRLAAYLLTGALSATCGVLPGTPGSALSATVITQSTNLNVRTGPARWYPRVDSLANGSSVVIDCQVDGETTTGTERTTNRWDRTRDGAFVSDAYIRRGGSLPMCPSTPSRPPGVWTHPLPGFAVQGGFHTAQRPSHAGVDLMSFKGTPIRAAAAGTVLEIVCNIQEGGSCDVDGTPQSRGCGWYVKIGHPGKIATLYCHMLRRPDMIKVGQKVRAGDVIGIVGTSGSSSFPHLHFEVHVNAPPTNPLNAVDPLTFMESVGAPLPRA